MRKVAFFFKKYFIADGNQSPQDRRNPNSRSNNRSGGGGGGETPTEREEHPWPSGGNPTRSHRPPPSGVTVSDRPIGQQRPARRTRRRRRTASPVGLPLYSEEPRDQEMSLFKHQTADMNPSQLDLALSPSIEVDEASDEDEDDDEELRDGRGEEDTLPAIERTTSLSPLPTPHAFYNRPRSASDSMARLTTTSAASRNNNNPYGSNSSSPFASRSGLIDLPPGNLQNMNNLSPTVSRDGTSTPPRSSLFGHRPTRSSPITSSSTSLSSPPRPNLGRPRASTLQRLLGDKNSSSSFLPAVGASPGRSPYGQFAGGGGGGSGANSPAGSRSLHRFATGSTTSINTLDISEPVPGSFVHSSFVFPKSGPTPEQVRFIASRESLGAYGYTAEPPPFEPSTSAFSTTAPGSPTNPIGLSPGRTSPEIGRSSPLGQVQGRGRSGSTASSPLARRTSTSSPPPRRSRDGGEGSIPPGRSSLAIEHRHELGSEEENDEGLPFAVDDDERPASPSTNPIPVTSTSSSHVLAPSLFPADSSADHTSKPQSNRPEPPPFRRLNTSSPPPEIFTLPATPTASSFPSPILDPSSTFSSSTSHEIESIVKG